MLAVSAVSIESTPPYGGEQRRKGERAALPTVSRFKQFPVILTAEPQCRLGTHHKGIGYVLSARGMVASVLRSDVLCAALERVHLNRCLLAPRSCFRTHGEL